MAGSCVSEVGVAPLPPSSPWKPSCSSSLVQQPSLTRCTSTTSSAFLVSGLLLVLLLVVVGGVERMIAAVAGRADAASRQAGAANGMVVVQRDHQRVGVAQFCRED